MSVSDHLRVQDSSRGFAQMPPVAGAYGGTVRAYESSSASGPRLWLQVEDSDGEVTLHLDAEVAWQLADQLRQLVRSHYQGDATPEWAQDQPVSGESALAALQLLTGTCENNTIGDCYGDIVRLEAGGYGRRTPDAQYTAERWCTACTARAGLDGKLGAV